MASLSGPLTLTGSAAGTKHIIYVNGGTLTLDGVTAKDHTASSGNGAIAVASLGSLTLNNCEINNLKAARGALYLNGYSGAFSFSATNTKFVNNTSTSLGGAVTTYNGITSVFTNCSFVGNTAASYGGAFATYNGSGSNDAKTTFKDCTFTGNTATEAGKDAALFLRGTTVLDGVTMSGNSSYDAVLSTGTLTLKGATAMESIYLASGRTVALDDTFSCAEGQISIDGAAISNGTTVLTGSEDVLFDHYIDFTLADESLELSSDGKATTSFIPV